jgi:hypothetical protein
LFNTAGNWRTSFIAGTVTDAQGAFTIRVATPSPATCSHLRLRVTSIGRYEVGDTRPGQITCTDQCQHFEWDLPRKHVGADEIRPAERSLCVLK